MGGKAWKQHELDALADMIDTHTAQEIADEFERPISSVYYKIREMNGGARKSRPIKPKPANWPFKENK